MNYTESSVDTLFRYYNSEPTSEDKLYFTDLRIMLMPCMDTENKQSLFNKELDKINPAPIDLFCILIETELTFFSKLSIAALPLGEISFDELWRAFSPCRFMEASE